MPLKPRILIADDEPVIADTLAIILNQSGFEARAVYSGEEAIQTAAAFAPDMLVSDVIMAGLDGIETAILMRSLLPQIKVLLFSGQAAAANLLSEARSRGYEFELLAKPVHPKDLLRSLRSSGIDPASQSSVPSDARHPFAHEKWIDIAPGELPVEPITDSIREN